MTITKCNFKAKLRDSEWCQLTSGMNCPGEDKCILFRTYKRWAVKGD